MSAITIQVTSLCVGDSDLVIATVWALSGSAMAILMFLATMVATCWLVDERDKATRMTSSARKLSKSSTTTPARLSTSSFRRPVV